MIRLFFIITMLLFSVNLNAESNSTKTEKIFKPFTGKLTGNKVRVRLNPDLDAHIITSLNKNDIVLVVKDEKDFWAIKPFSHLKAYIFRSYVIDNLVEADRVNVRLEPNLDSPVIGQLHNKDKVKGEICSHNNKWLEIPFPNNIHFYIAKEYITYAGNADYYTTYQTRKKEVNNLLNSAYFITQAECKKPFDEMAPQEAISQFDTIIKNYSDFPQYVEQAKEGLSLLQDNYLQKKLAYLEAKANMSHMEKNELLEAIEKTKNFEKEENASKEEQTISKKKPKNIWQSIENSLYTTWTTFHPEKKISDFYKEQEINAITITGVIENYSMAIKNKPGDFIITKDNETKAYLYSTKCDLNQHVGKKITMKVSPRPNNNFAFPAYFVNSIEVQ